jgi:hypothetical protein
MIFIFFLVSLITCPFQLQVARESPNNGTSIEIPPPRPKRRPMHPYPRKFGNQKNEYPTTTSKKLEKPPLQASSVTEEGTGSPFSVLSSIGSENSNQIVCRSPTESSGSGSDDPDSRSQSPTATSAEAHLCTDSDAPVTVSLLQRLIY